MRLSVALDGAGWHPAAWREPRARPGELFTARYWADVIAEAERGLLDFVTIEDGFSVQSTRADQVAGRLDAVLIAARVSPVTRHIGLVPTVIVTHTEPFHIAKAIATLDYASNGRAGVRVRVSASPEEAAHVGRRDPLPAADLLAEAGDYVEVVRRLWDSWEDGAEIRDVATGRFIDRDRLHYIDFTGRYFSVKGPSITPRPPQGQPVVGALGHGPGAYRLIARSADIGFVTPRDAGHARDIVAEIGSAPESLVLADLVVFLGATAGEAAARQARMDERAGYAFTSDAAIAFLEQVWNRDLSGYDPDGPLPGIDPAPGENTVARGRASVRMYRDPRAVAAQWRAKAEEGKLSIRELIIEVTGRQTFTGSPATVADQINTLVQADASDGFILVPHITPGGLDEFADTVVPLLQERGVFRSDYEGTTLREHLGLAPLEAP